MRAKLSVWLIFPEIFGRSSRLKISVMFLETRLLFSLQQSKLLSLFLYEKRAKPLATMATPASRSKALSLYRKLMRGAMKMPTPNRQNFVIRKTRTEFKAAMGLTDPEEIHEAIRLADTNLDTVLVQAEHLTKLMQDPKYDDV